jgi:hypothetical protein
MNKKVKMVGALVIAIIVMVCFEPAHAFKRVTNHEDVVLTDKIISSKFKVDVSNYG